MVVLYTAMALEMAEQVANIFEKTYGIKVELTRSASERVVARVIQEAQAGINNVDIIEISEAGDFALLKQKGLLRAHRPKNYERFPSTFLLDKDGYFHAWRATIAQPVYNTRLVLASAVPSHGRISSTLYGKTNSSRSTMFRVPGPTSWLPSLRFTVGTTTAICAKTIQSSSKQLPKASVLWLRARERFLWRETITTPCGSRPKETQ